MGRGHESPSQGYPQQYVAGTHLHTWVERDNVEQSFLSKETIQWQGPGDTGDYMFATLI